MSAAHLRLVPPPEPEEIDEAAEALAPLSPTEATRALIAAYYEARAAFDLEVAESRRRADALLEVIARWLDGMEPRSSLPHDCTHAEGCDREDNDEFCERYTGFFGLDDFALNLGFELDRGPHFCATKVLESVRRAVGQDWVHTHIPSGDRITAAFEAAITASSAPKAGGSSPAK